MAPILDKINNPEDLKGLSNRELVQVADEVRAFIKETTSFTGGHIGSGLGVAELTVALHHVFNFKKDDHLILDVGHQCYPHKILTGRKDRMMTMRQKGGLSGFPDPKESEYDRVKTGHGGSSLSSAMGMAIALKKKDPLTPNRVVAMIGDASLQEGAALEALNYGGVIEELPLIIILNDNAHGIGPAGGSLSKYFSKIRSAMVYRTARGGLKRLVRRVERRSNLFGRIAMDFYNQLRVFIHSFVPKLEQQNWFEQLNFFYYGPIDGHDMRTLVEALKISRSFKRPVLLHCITQKGRGHSEIEDRLAYHAGKPDSTLSAHLPPEHSRMGSDAYTDIFADETIELAKKDSRVVAITAAMADGTGLIRFKKIFPDRFIDAGMAEQHAVGLAQGLALGGMKPVCAIYSTFLQRAVDQIFQELALIKTPVMLCLDRAGVVGADGATHNGVFDISYCRMFPGMTVMAPRDGKELRMMMQFAHGFNGPTAIRFPRTKIPKSDHVQDHQPLELGKSEQLRVGDDGSLIAYGSMVYPCLDVAEILEKEHHLRFSVINARFVKPLDEEMLRSEFERQPVIFTVEEHVESGGFGSAILEKAQSLELPTQKLRLIAIADHWVDHGQRVEALHAAGLSVEQLVKRILVHVPSWKKEAVQRVR